MALPFLAQQLRVSIGELFGGFAYALLQLFRVLFIQAIQVGFNTFG
jgi:hypothetical protein